MPGQYPRYRSSLQSNLKAAQKPRRWRLLALVAIGIVLLLVPIVLISKSKHPSAANTTKATEPTYDKTRYSVDDPVSPWLVVNKQRPLNPATYAPTDLRAPSIKLKGAKTTEAMQVRDEAATALETLVAAAKNEGLNLMLVSGYRSYDSQKTIYDSEVKGFGQAVADQESARPGHSEHQTGWAADLGRTDGKCEIDKCFADTPEGQWLAANAYKYGFLLRYPDDKTSVTGYIYEPWHIRYVGTDLANELHRTGITTLEEFFSLAAAPGY